MGKRNLHKILLKEGEMLLEVVHFLLLIEKVWIIYKSRDLFFQVHIPKNRAKLLHVRQEMSQTMVSQEEELV